MVCPRYALPLLKTQTVPCRSSAVSVQVPVAVFRQSWTVTPATGWESTIVSPNCNAKPTSILPVGAHGFRASAVVAAIARTAAGIVLTFGVPFT